MIMVLTRRSARCVDDDGFADALFASMGSSGEVVSDPIVLSSALGETSGVGQVVQGQDAHIGRGDLPASMSLPPGLMRFPYRIPRRHPAH